MIAVGRIGDREGRYDRIMISDCKIIAVHGIGGWRVILVSYIISCKGAHESDANVGCKISIEGFLTCDVLMIA